MEYTKQYIDTLLQKFMDAQTSEEEEQLLADYFATAEDIPAEWEAYKDIFQSFETDAYEMSDKYLDEKFNEDKVSDTTVEKLPEVSTSIPIKPKIMWWRYTGVAAAVAVIMAIGITLTQRDDEKNSLASVSKTEAPQQKQVRKDTMTVVKTVEPQLVAEVKESVQSTVKQSDEAVVVQEETKLMEDDMLLAEDTSDDEMDEETETRNRILAMAENDIDRFCNLECHDEMISAKGASLARRIEAEFEKLRH